jgi:hypothetical protein
VGGIYAASRSDNPDLTADRVHPLFRTMKRRERRDPVAAARNTCSRRKVTFMSITTFSFPTKTLFGVGAIQELPKWLDQSGIKRPLVVTDPGLRPTDAFRALACALDESGQGNRWFLYSGVHPNPIETDVVESADAFRKNGCDAVIGFGGGSALDVGKAARVLVKRTGFDLGKFYSKRIGRPRSVYCYPDDGRHRQRSWPQFGHHAQRHQAQGRDLPS